MKKDEALKLALEAMILNNAEWKRLADSGDGGYWSAEDQDHYKQTEQAITAIKEALAQPEQDGKCKYCTDGCPACDARKLPEQERFLVATIGNWGRVEWADGVFPSLGDKMYSAPRTWVGLTNDEVNNLAAGCHLGNSVQDAIYKAAAKLKEKNT